MTCAPRRAPTLGGAALLPTFGLHIPVDLAPPLPALSCLSTELRRKTRRSNEDAVDGLIYRIMMGLRVFRADLWSL